VLGKSVSLPVERCHIVTKEAPIMSQAKRWTVTTSGQPLDDIAHKLSAAGFSVDQVLTEIGCVTGTADAQVAERLRSIPGVIDVSEEVAFDVGPPGDADTW
jgi:hypothetical protein